MRPRDQDAARRDIPDRGGLARQLQLIVGFEAKVEEALALVIQMPRLGDWFLIGLALVQLDIEPSCRPYGASARNREIKAGIFGKGRILLPRGATGSPPSWSKLPIPTTLSLGWGGGLHFNAQMTDACRSPEFPHDSASGQCY